jgi:hypothetical protein
LVSTEVAEEVADLDQDKLDLAALDATLADTTTQDAIDLLEQELEDGYTYVPAGAENSEEWVANDDGSGRRPAGVTEADWENEDNWTEFGEGTEGGVVRQYTGPTGAATRGAPPPGVTQEDYDNPDNWTTYGGGDSGDVSEYTGPTRTANDVQDEIDDLTQTLKDTQDARDALAADIAEKEDFLSDVLDPFEGLEEVTDVKDTYGSLAKGSSLLNLTNFRDDIEQDRRKIIRAGQEDIMGMKLQGEHMGGQIEALKSAQSLSALRNQIGAVMKIGSMGVSLYNMGLGSGLIGMARPGTSQGGPAGGLSML